MKLTPDEIDTVNKVLGEVVGLRDAVAKLVGAMADQGMETTVMDQMWQRYANAETVLVELRDEVEVDDPVFPAGPQGEPGPRL
jgi:hypothetical protein